METQRTGCRESGVLHRELEGRRESHTHTDRERERESNRNADRQRVGAATDPQVVKVPPC